MPYINPLRRSELEGYTKLNLQIETPGELNYLMTCLAIRYLKKAGLSYDVINDILGAFSGASAEFYRRVAVPYEGTKMAVNGDVY